MANLEFCDTHNIVAYLQKPEGSEEFHQIVDFLNTSHIRYALTKNPTIFVSLMQQFWQTATTRTLKNGEMEITATINGKVKVVTEASVKRHLKLEDSEVADEAASIGVDIRRGGATTTVTSLDVGQGSGNIDKTLSMPYDLPLLRVNTLGIDEGSMTLQELTILCTILSQKVESLEADLKQTNKVYGVPYTKLIMKVKKLEKTVKTSQARRKAKIVESDEETYTRRRVVSTSSGGVNTASRMISTDEESVKTAGALMPVSTAGMVDKGKGIIEESESDVTKTKRQKEQEILGLETTIRLQEQFDEEERQRMARVHKAAQTFTKEEWENIRARIKADEELTQRLQAEEKDNKINFVLIESEDDKAVPKLAESRSSKRDAEEELDQVKSKKQKIGESSDPRNNDADELSQEELQ
nr:xylulose kinase-1 [Tanacetum cinerariifolium]